MKRILLVVLLVASCDSGKPKEKPIAGSGSGSGSVVAEAKPPVMAPAPPPVDAIVAPDPATGSGACDAEALKEQGMQNINLGEHAKALEKIEASLACKDDAYVKMLAFMESCASGNSPKAKVYYKTLTAAQQTKFAQICLRQKPPVEFK